MRVSLIRAAGKAFREGIASPKLALGSIWGLSN